jgi:hypothetical protein
MKEFCVICTKISFSSLMRPSKKDVFSFVLGTFLNLRQENINETSKFKLIIFEDRSLVV